MIAPSSSETSPRSSPSHFCRKVLLYNPRSHRTPFTQHNTMSSIAAMASRRAFARQAVFRAPQRRLYSSKMEESSLDKAPKRDPELYVRTSRRIRST